MASHRRPSKADVMELHRQAADFQSYPWHAGHVLGAADMDAESAPKYFRGQPSAEAAHNCSCTVAIYRKGSLNRQEGLCMALLAMQQACTSCQ